MHPDGGMPASSPLTNIGRDLLDLWKTLVPSSAESGSDDEEVVETGKSTKETEAARAAMLQARAAQSSSPPKLDKKPKGIVQSRIPDAASAKPSASASAEPAAAAAPKNEILTELFKQIATVIKANQDLKADLDAERKERIAAEGKLEEVLKQNRKWAEGELKALKEDLGKTKDRINDIEEDGIVAIKQ